MTSGINQLKNGSSSLVTGSQTFGTNLSQFAKAGDQLQSGSNTLSNATQSAYAGSQQLSAGTSQLVSGASSLTSGVNQLKDGSSTLSSSSTQIKDGISSLASGSTQLYNGTVQFKQEGLDQLSGEGNQLISEVGNIMDVKDELVTASEEYNNYSGINSDDMNGKVRFVFKVEESEDKDTKSESQKTDTTKDNTQEKKGFVDWIKGLFNK